MSAKIGLECHAYYNTGSNASPVWVDITSARDVSISGKKDKGDVSKRGGGGFKYSRGTLIDLDVSMEIVTDPADASYAYLQARWLDRAAVQFAICNGDILTTGTSGFKAYYEVMDFEDKQPLDGSALTSVSLGLTDPGSNPNPARFTV